MKTDNHTIIGYLQGDRVCKSQLPTWDHFLEPQYIGETNCMIKNKRVFHYWHCFNPVNNKYTVVISKELP